MQKVDILAIGVHPDDVELACSGTLLHHIAMGKTVALLDLTRGELGTRGSADIRDREAANAAKLMGAVARQNLCMADGFFERSPENVLKIVQAIRHFQPQIVLCNAISDRHPDHGRAAKLTADACFYAGLAKIETRDAATGEPQARHRPQAVYHYIQDRFLQPDFVVDITPYLAQKMKLILTYESQFYNTATEDTELSTPISGKDFLETVVARSRDFGRPVGFEHAEGFQAARTVGVSSLFDLV